MVSGVSAVIGIVGDFNPKNRTHRFTNTALDHLGLRFEWVPTDATRCQTVFPTARAYWDKP